MSWSRNAAELATLAISRATSSIENSSMYKAASWAVSGRAPVLEQITGVPAAIASNTVRPNGSWAAG